MWSRQSQEKWEPTTDAGVELGNLPIEDAMEVDVTSPIIISDESHNEDDDISDGFIAIKAENNGGNGFVAINPEGERGYGVSNVGAGHSVDRSLGVRHCSLFQQNETWSICTSSYLL